MKMIPFSEDDFLNVFAAYNSALWPAVLVLWIATSGIVLRWWIYDRGDRSIHALLAVHWAWSGIVYHWIFFRSINAGAVLFGSLFVVQALIFAWLAYRKRGHYNAGWSFRGFLSGCLLVYAFLYPVLGLLSGLEYPRLPLYAVPCPTTLFTAGMLLASSGLPRKAYILPAIWSAIGGSAALLLGIHADFVLLVAGALLMLDIIVPKTPGRKAA
jgi:hypothetical protein